MRYDALWLFHYANLRIMPAEYAESAELLFMVFGRRHAEARRTQGKLFINFKKAIGQCYKYLSIFSIYFFKAVFVDRY
jgi:hypothetical protein